MLGTRGATHTTTQMNIKAMQSGQSNDEGTGKQPMKKDMELQGDLYSDGFPEGHGIFAPKGGTVHQPFEFKSRV